MKQQKGFTLIELMIVVAIIGILASIAVPMYRDYITKSRLGTVVASMAQLQTAITLEENSGTLVANLDAANGNQAQYQALGLRNAPDAANIEGVSAINVVDGVIQLTFDTGVDADLNGFRIDLTPSFGATNTRWVASIGTGTLNKATTPSHFVMAKYFNDTLNKGLASAQL